MKSHLIVGLLFSCSLVACHSMNPMQIGSKPVDHSILDSLLRQYVDGKGMVDYQAFAKDKKRLDNYLDILQKSGPSDEWSEDEQLSYWINAYNAFTIRLIIDHYPVESIKDIGSKIQIPFVNTAWDIKFINISGKELSLNNIEHNIIRQNFDEPRIHFALVCAAKSCPKLRNEVYTAKDLDEQLTDQAKSFLSNPSKNKISENEIEISKIFSWYGGDFTKEGKLINFLNKYSDTKIAVDAKKSFKKYDWSLNEQ